MSAHHFFGYGSLVNTATHDFANLRPARLKGWRRAWRHTAHRPVAFLTAVPAPGAEIWGAVADVPRDDWGALDAREYAYARVMVTAAIEAEIAEGDVAVYAIEHGQHHAPTPDNPILQSYLDVVLAGYERVFGVAGLAHFLDTTDGWHAPVLQDRAAPRYSRAQTIDAATATRFDGLLETKGILRI